MTIRMIINNNGTDKEQLLKQRMDVIKKLEEAKALMSHAYPHGRDYQLNEDPVGDRLTDLEEHHHRFALLDELIEGLSQDYIALDHQGR